MLSERRYTPDPRREAAELAAKAEDLVIDYFEQTYPDLSARLSSDGEDSGLPGGQKTDVFIYEGDDKRPNYLMGIQVTYASDSAVLHQKVMEELFDPRTNRLQPYAFVRPEDWPHTFHPIPRPVVVLRPHDVKNFDLGKDSWDKHPQLEQSLIAGVNNSLILIARASQHQWQKEEVNALLQRFGANAVMGFLKTHQKGYERWAAAEIQKLKLANIK